METLHLFVRKMDIQGQLQRTSKFRDTSGAWALNLSGWSRPGKERKTITRWSDCNDANRPQFVRILHNLSKSTPTWTSLGPTSGPSESRQTFWNSIFHWFTCSPHGIRNNPLTDWQRSCAKQFIAVHSSVSCSMLRCSASGPSISESRLPPSRFILASSDPKLIPTIQWIRKRKSWEVQSITNQWAASTYSQKQKRGFKEYKMEFPGVRGFFRSCGKQTGLIDQS